MRCAGGCRWGGGSYPGELGGGGGWIVHRCEVDVQVMIVMLRWAHHHGHGPCTVQLHGVL